MRIVRFAVGLVLAAAGQTLGLYLDASFLLAIDLFLLLALAMSLEYAPVGSMLIGSAAGLAQDALTGGLFGLHGFADTVVAWAASRIRQRVVIQQPLQIGMLFALAAAVQLTLLLFLQFLMLPGADLPGLHVMVIRMVTTGAGGMLLFVFNRRLRERFEVWREKRRRRLSLEIRSTGDRIR